MMKRVGFAAVAALVCHGAWGQATNEFCSDPNTLQLGEQVKAARIQVESQAKREHAKAAEEYAQFLKLQRDNHSLDDVRERLINDRQTQHVLDDWNDFHPEYPLSLSGDDTKMWQQINRYHFSILSEEKRHLEAEQSHLLRAENLEKRVAQMSFGSSGYAAVISSLCSPAAPQ